MSDNTRSREGARSRLFPMSLHEVCDLLYGDPPRSQVRRIVRPQPYVIPENSSGEYAEFHWDRYAYMDNVFPEPATMVDFCPHARVGDTLLVQETHCADVDFDGRMIGVCTFKAGCAPDEMRKHAWRPPVMLSREFCRFALHITQIRAERLQDISDDDVIAEQGVGNYFARGEFRNVAGVHLAFRDMWNMYHPKDWQYERDPWVWALTFDVKRLNE